MCRFYCKSGKDDQVITQDEKEDDLETVECKFCGEEIALDTAHLHQSEYVGECCWDERLRITE
jgi:hypothetical protein